MTDLSLPAILLDPRIAAHAVSASPAWLVSADAASILWANPTGAAIFGAASAGEIAGQPCGSPQLANLVMSLPRGGAARLQRLRGLGGRLGLPLLCQCSRIAIGGTSAVLVVALETAGPALALAERVRRLFDGSDCPVVALSADGALLYANPTGMTRLGDAAAQSRIDSGALGGQVVRLGSGADEVSVAMFADVAAPAELAAPAVAVTPADQPAASPQPPASSSPVPVPPLRIEVPIPERRHPLRFVWQMDPGGRFTLGSDAFTEVIGPNTATALGRPWSDIAAELALDPEDQVTRAVATRDTWSGITVSWPVDGSADRLKIELSGLPVYDRDRNFLGYRGFGVCRDIDRIATLAQMRRMAAMAGVTPAEPPPRPAEPPRTVRTEPEERPVFAVVPAAANVLPFRAPAPPADAKTAALSPVERNAFRELARQLTARLKGAETGEKPAAAPPLAGSAEPAPPASHEPPDVPQPPPATERPLLDRMPMGILIHRYDQLLYANRAFLDWAGHATLDTLAEAGGLDSLFIESSEADAAAASGRTLTIATPRGDRLAVEGRLIQVPWDGEDAMALLVATTASDERHKATGTVLRVAEADVRELRAILDIATDGVVVIARDGRIQSLNRSAEALFGYAAADTIGRPFTDLFAPDSARLALDYLNRLSQSPLNAVMNGGHEMTGRVRQGGELTLFVTLGRIADDTDKYAVVCRDITAWKKAESDLVAAKQEAERASSAKSEFLAKISHEIRTPLNSIIGFSEVMLSERFGPIGNDRYRDYLKDIHESGGHVVALVNDLLDLSKIEAGKLDMTFVNVDLNDLVQSSVAAMQPQANRERIIIRISLAPGLRPVVADARTVRQIVFNLLSNAIKFTGAGGQVIVSTAQSGGGEVMLRVRDTGIGMTDKDLAIAMEPFRQLPNASKWGSGGSGLGLPLTKALAEANRARFTISSKVNDGTLVEVAFPPTRVLVE